jgi:hypothetical protein
MSNLYTCRTFIHVELVYMSNLYTCRTCIHVELLYMSNFYTCRTFIHVELLYMSNFYTCRTFIHVELLYTCRTCIGTCRTSYEVYLHVELHEHVERRVHTCLNFFLSNFIYMWNFVGIYVQLWIHVELTAVKLDTGLKMPINFLYRLLCRLMICAQIKGICRKVALRACNSFEGFSYCVCCQAATGAKMNGIEYLRDHFSTIWRMFAIQTGVNNYELPWPAVWSCGIVSTFCVE